MAASNASHLSIELKRPVGTFRRAGVAILLHTDNIVTANQGVTAIR